MSGPGTQEDTSAGESPEGRGALTIERPGVGGRWRRRAHRVLHEHPTVGPVAVLVLSILVFATITPSFRTPSNLGLVLQQVTVIAVLALGQAIIILTAGIDLSVGAIAVFGSITMGIASAQWGLDGVLALMLGVLVAVTMGAINGGLVAGLRLPPFLVTLATLSIFGTLTTLATGGANIRAADMAGILSWTGTPIQIGTFRVTYATFIMFALYAAIAYVMSSTAWGKHVVAVGDDRDAARLAGIRTRRVLLSVYGTAGLIYGIGSWIIIGRLGAASPNAGADYNLDAITAVVIGGISLFGGRGRVWGALVGALVVGVFRNGLQLAGVPVEWQGLAIGLLVLAAVAVDQQVRSVGAAR